MVQAKGGATIATRNLLLSMPNLFCAFGVWLSWSIIAVKIQQMNDRDPVSCCVGFGQFILSCMLMGASAHA